MCIKTFPIYMRACALVCVYMYMHKYTDGA